MLVKTPGAFYKGYLHASNALSLTIYCRNSDSSSGISCLDSHFYVPPSTVGSTQINCYGHGCYQYLYVHTENSGSYIDVKIYGCSVCTNVSDCIYQWDILCTDSSTMTEITDYFYGSYCEYCNCDCDDIIISYQESDDSNPSLLNSTSEPSLEVSNSDNNSSDYYSNSTSDSVSNYNSDFHSSIVVLIIVGIFFGLVLLVCIFCYALKRHRSFSC